MSRRGKIRQICDVIGQSDLKRKAIAKGNEQGLKCGLNAAKAGEGLPGMQARRRKWSRVNRTRTSSKARQGQRSMSSARLTKGNAELKARHGNEGRARRASGSCRQQVEA